MLLFYEEYRKVIVSFNLEKVKSDYVESPGDSRSLILPTTFSSYSVS